MGRKQLKDDYTRAAATFGANSYIKDLQYDPETIMFSFECKGHSVSFTLGIDDTYPEGSMLFPSDGEPKTYSVGLPLLLEDVCKVYCKKFGIKYEEPAKVTAPATATTTPAASTSTAASSTSSASQAAAAKAKKVEEEEEEEDEDEDMDAFETDHMGRSPRLEEDIKLARAHGFGVTFREYQSIDVLDVQLHINSSFIDHRIASAWGLAFGKPLTVRLALSPSLYDNSSTYPKVEVIQDNARCGLSTQMTQIVNAFCAAHWQKFGQCTNRDAGGHTGTGTAAAASHAQNPNAKKEAENKSGKGGGGGGLFGLGGKKNVKEEVPAGVTDKDISRLVDMGFEVDMAVRALTAAGGNVEEASHLLLDDESALYNAKKKSETTATGSKDKGDLFGQEKADRELKRYQPKYSEGFLLQLCRYVSFRLPTLNRYCVICDGNHLFVGGACLLRPAVCARELCCFAFQALGVMSDAADGIATQAEVVDLLVGMAIAAANSARKELILDPFPTLCDTVDRSKMVLSATLKNYTLLSEIFAVFPSIEDMMLVQEVTDMKAHLDKAHKYCFPLLQWIINSNRSHIEKLPESKHVKSMNTAFQYVLLSAPPEKEAEFNKLKAQHGTIFAFHGSPVENWHCILRTGLRNASGTKLQINGAAYGNGIYLSPFSQTSFGYANRYYGTPQATANKKSNGRFLGSSTFHCVALCEVINTTAIRKNSGIWVCPEESHVVTRFFFVWPVTQNVTAPNVNTETDTFLAEVRAALSLV